ncbi:hypothetical protein [Kitasatospora sp. NPDC085464]|uniref:hypothetical protein n=1 Tax=Kitasatospora sp. NPDC085464 TaxID=3364063 RepID=UPI0037C79015
MIAGIERRRPAPAAAVSATSSQPVSTHPGATWPPAALCAAEASATLAVANATARTHRTSDAAVRDVAVRAEVDMAAPS